MSKRRATARSLAEDGRLLVEARYAVRNNQRSFLKVSLPPGAQLWTPQFRAGRFVPVSPRQDAVLLPLEKGRAGEAAPTFVVEIDLPAAASVDRQGVGPDRSAVIDLPVSRTGFSCSTRRAFASRSSPARSDRRRPRPFAEAFRVRCAATGSRLTVSDADQSATGCNR